MNSMEEERVELSIWILMADRGRRAGRIEVHLQVMILLYILFVQAF